LEITKSTAKENFLEELSKIGGNYKNFERTERLKKRIEKYQEGQSEEDVQLYDVLRIIKAHEQISRQRSFEEIYKTASPTVKRLLNIPPFSWTIEDIRIAQLTFSLVDSFEDAEKLCELALTALNKFVDKLKTTPISFFIHLNMLMRILRARFLEIDHEKEKKRLHNAGVLFKTHFNNVLAISKGKDNEFKKFRYFALIRAGLFDEDSELVSVNLEKLKREEDKQLYNAAKEEIRRYRPSRSVILYQRHFSVLVGANIKAIRLSLNLDVDIFSDKIGISKSYLASVESGERNYPAFRLLELSTALGISLDEVFYGEPTQNKVVDEKSRMLKKMQLTVSNLSEKSVAVAEEFIENLQYFENKMLGKRLFLDLEED